MKRFDEIIKTLIGLYPTDKCALDHSTNFELLVAVVLSAQCTDKRVNEITKILFPLASSPQEMILLGEERLYEIIKPCGLGKSKAKNLIAASRDILSKHGGDVPGDFDSLCALSGVGEKTASVVLAVGFNIPAFAVDTHVFRVSNRIGIVCENSAHGAMVGLKKKIDKNLWIDGHYAMVLHGRSVCTARRPKCEDCAISEKCKFYLKQVKRG